MKITKITGREIFDSRGMPTVECELVLDNEILVRSSVPSGLSRSKYEAVELRDGDMRLEGKGVSKAINMLETVIAPALLGKEPEIVEMDIQMLELDGTDDKSRLGSNAILAASIAVLRAQAINTEVESYELIAYLCNLNSVSIPFPMFNIINGGLHAQSSNLPVQEIMIVPVGEQNFRASMESAVTLFYYLKKLFKQKNKSTAVGDEGGFAAHFSTLEEALDLIMEALHNAQQDFSDRFMLAIDSAASTFYDTNTKKYTWGDALLSTDQMIEKYAALAQQYPLYALEDGLAQDDEEGWRILTEKLGKTLQIVGDDIFATNPHRIAHGIEQGIANAVIIKPDQIGTVTETLQAINLCKEYEYNTIISHRSGETNDTFIVDLAVGTSAGHIKTGGCTRGERLAKYNQLLRIEDELMLSLLNL